MNLIVVTIKDSDDWDTHKDLYQYAFNNYISYKIVKKSNFQVIGDKYYKGTFYIKEDIYITIKKDTKEQIIGKIVLEKKKNYKNNDKVGEYKIYLETELIKKVPIYIKNVKNRKNKILKNIIGEMI